MDTLYACIMAGGSGERFWPLSRRTRPKHLLKLFTDQTMIGQTAARLEGMVPEERMFVLTNEVQLPGTREALPSFAESQILAEPAKRDTAPAAALATALVARKNPDGLVALLPADALIKDCASFRRQLLDAARLAESSGAFATISIKPSWPSTGFGYLELGDSLGQGAGGSRQFKVARFVEKPDAEKARQYFDSGTYGWNAGIFVWKVSSFVAEARKNAPELAAFIQSYSRADDPSAVLASEFPNLPKISVDYAIMEKAAEVVAVESEFDWDDVGAWTALPAHFGVDEKNNSIRGNAALHESENNIVISQSRTIALCGVKDLVVVETPDSVLVCHRDAVQDVKKLQPLLPDEVK